MAFVFDTQARIKANEVNLSILAYINSATDNDTILYFPIRQASLCVLSDYIMGMLSFLFFLSYCIPFCVKVRLPVLSIRLFLFLYFIFYFLWWMTWLMVLIVIDSTIMNVCSTRNNNAERLFWLLVGVLGLCLSFLYSNQLKTNTKWIKLNTSWINLMRTLIKFSLCLSVPFLLSGMLIWFRIFHRMHNLPYRGSHINPGLKPGRVDSVFAYKAFPTILSKKRLCLFKNLSVIKLYGILLVIFKFAKL